MDAKRTSPVTPWKALALSAALHGVAAVGVVVALAGAAPEATPGPVLQCAHTVAFQPPEDASALDDVMPLQDPVDDLVLDPLVEPGADPHEESAELPELAPDVVETVPVLEAHTVPLHAAKPRTPAPVAAAPVARPSPAKPAAQPVRRPAPARTRPATGLQLVSRPDLLRYYPAEARRRGIEGRALVEIVVDASGRVSRADLVTSSGSSLLDRQAVRVMYEYRFAPGTGGRARVPVDFRLR